MKKAHLLIQRWFASGEGWAYDSDFPNEERPAVIEKISRAVRERSSGKNVQDEYKKWKMYIYIMPDKDCLDPKAKNRHPHIDICVLIPSDWENPDAKAKKLCAEALKIHEIGSFTCPSCERERGGNSAGTQIQIGAGVFVAAVLVLLLTVKQWSGSPQPAQEPPREDKEEVVQIPETGETSHEPPSSSKGSEEPGVPSIPEIVLEETLEVKPAPEFPPPADPEMNLSGTQEEAIVKGWGKDIFQSPTKSGLETDSFEKIDENRFDYVEFFKTYQMKSEDCVTPMPAEVKDFVRQFSNVLVSEHQKEIARGLAPVLPAGWEDENDCQCRPWLIVWYVMYRMNLSSPPQAYDALDGDPKRCFENIKKINPDWVFEEDRDFYTEFQNVWKLWEHKHLLSINEEARK